MTLKEVLETAYNINPQAKRNVGRGNAKKREMERKFGNCGSVSVHLARKQDDVVKFARDCLLQRIKIAIIDSGDGGVKNFMTHYFRQLFRQFGKGMTPPEFARVMNLMALDPSSGLCLPAIYHNPNGTVNCYSEIMGMTRNMDHVAENIEEAEKGMYRTLGMAAFRRTYVPTLILYPADNPSDLERVHIMTLYADTSVYDFFEKYDNFKDQGGAGMITAMRMLGRCAASISLSTALDTLSEKRGRKLYEERYIDEIIHTAECAMTIDDKVRLNERSVTAMGTMGVSLYGLKPFWRMPNTAEGFVHYNAGFVEDKSRLGKEAIEEKDFQALCGTPKPIDLVLALPDIYKGNNPHIPGMTDRLAKRVCIAEKEEMDVIADGSRQNVGDKMLIQIAYMQPFINLDQRPGSI